MNKKNRYLIIGATLIVGVLAFVIMLINNNNYNNFAPTIFEKKWLNDHRDELVDINIFNDVPVMGNEGKGVAFDFTNDLKKAIDLDFNVMPYTLKDNPEVNKYGFRVIGIDQKITKNDLLFYQDNYVLVSKNANKINDFNTLNGQKIGVLKSDFAYVSTYLNNAGILYEQADDGNGLVSMLNTNVVNYIILPHNLYSANIIGLDNYYVNYNINDISLKYVFHVDPKEEKLTKIIKKYYYYWNKNHRFSAVNRWRLATFYDMALISDQERTEFKAKVYNYAYINELPYADHVNNDNIGVISDYIDDFARFAGITIKFNKYRDNEELIAKNKADIFYADLNKLQDNQTMTSSVVNNEYYVLSNVKNIDVINNVNSLKNKNIYVVQDNSMYNYFKDTLKYDVKTVKNIKNLIKVSKNVNNYIIADTYTYNYLKNNELSEMVIRYRLLTNDAQGFIVNDNVLLHKMLNYYLMGINVEKNNNANVYYLISNPMKQSIYDTLAKYILIIVIISFIMMIVGYNLLQKKKVTVKILKEEKLKYIDQLTSLKNRNYLNDNIAAWDDNTIYPQAIMVIDLNNIKYINDNYGHEAGDDVIKKAASILINMQKENSDILRIDGNEFMIYLVGYPENEIVSYMRKLYKEIKNLPYDMGGAIGYSMIVDDIKTIDDAVNEATLDMRVNKETSQRN